jgi:Raf kinase inhibitor-like YbhB/YbcL family protein
MINARRSLSVSTMLLTLLLSYETFAEANKEEVAAEHYTNLPITTHIFKPHERPAPDIATLKVPEGFKIEKIAEKIGNARMIAISPSGVIYISRREEADVIKLNTDDKGSPNGGFERVASRAGLHGITFHEGDVYLATVNEIFRAKVKADGSFGPLEMIIDDLPDAGQHHTRTVQIGPDKMMYISVGSTCNECAEPNPEAATILRVSLDGKKRSIFAAGLRDTIGWGWQPGTGELWGMDHGIDWMGDDMPEELNRIENGKHYGWPYLYGENKINPRLDASGGMKKSEWVNRSSPMVLGYKGHSAPMQMAFYNSTQFPKDYEGDAFVSMHGSWNRKTASGYEVVRINFENGTAKTIEPFVTGFISGDSESGRPCGTAVTRDGSLIFSDDRNGVLYRVSYVGKETERAKTLSIPADTMLLQTQSKPNPKLALARAEADAKVSSKITLSSKAFQGNGKIPGEYSAYDQDANFDLSWTKGPAGTVSYVIIMEDPDSKAPPLPTLHWLVWNIPASETSLRQGLPKQERIVDPDGLRQGPNVTGSVGYYGPHPSTGDKAHRYHTQIFALDSRLELPPAADREDVLLAMKGHVLAKGELVGLFQKPDRPKKR